jgi:hypothetical protein
MGFRSMVRAGQDAYKASAKTDAGTDAGDPVPRGSEFAAAVVVKAIDYGSDKYWDAHGGPWIAQYRRFATVAANFHCLEPFADDADQRLVVLRDEAPRAAGRSGSQVSA